MMSEKPINYGFSEAAMDAAERNRLEDLGLWPKDHLQRFLEAAEKHDPGNKMGHELAAKYQPGGKCSCGKALAGECDVCNRPCQVCGNSMVAGKCLHHLREDHNGK